MEITISEHGTKGKAIARENNLIAGVMTYSIPNSDFIIIDHTEVNEEFKGRSVGKSMLLEMVNMARTKNIKILPLCPFAHAMFSKMEEIRDVLKK